MTALFNIIAPVFLVIGFGYVCVARGWFNDDGVDSIMKFAQGFAIPCLLFQAVAGMDLGTTVNAPLMVSYYLPALVCFGFGVLVARTVFKRPMTDSVAIGFCCLFANSVLLGLPITERAFGVDALGPNFAIIAIHAPFAYLVGITTMEIVLASGKPAAQIALQVMRAMFRNALVIGLALGFVVNLSGLQIPTVLNNGLDLMARAALPVALFGLGGVLVRYKPEGDMRVIIFICAVTLLLRPYLVSLTPAELTGPEMQSALITAAMPPGINAYIFANMYGVAKRVAASTVLIGTVLATFSTTLWLMFLGV